jgi:hypothetical protein
MLHSGTDEGVLRPPIESLLSESELYLLFPIGSDFAPSSTLVGREMISFK